MKRFFENTLISGAYSKALRVVALLCVLLGVSSSAWGAFYATGPAIGNGDWGGSNWVEMIEDNGTFKCPATAGKEFKISDNKNWNDIYWSGLQAGANVTKGANNGNGKINEGNYNTLCFGGNSNKWFWAEYNEAYADAKSYLIGTFSSTQWDTEAPAYEMTKNTGNTAENMIRGVHMNVNDEFMVYYQGVKYGCEKVSPNSTEVRYECATGEWDNVRVLESGTFDIYFDRDNHTIYIGKSTSGGGDDDGDYGECDRVEIYCRYEKSDIPNMNLHIWSSGGSALTPSHGEGVAGQEVTISGVKYSKWSFATKSKNLCVQFIAQDNKTYKTNTLCELSKGNSYYFTLPNNWGGNAYQPEKTEVLDGCESGDDPLGECDMIEIWARGKDSYTDISCKVSSGSATSTGIKSYNGNDYATWKVITKTDVAVNFCAGNNASYCTNASTMNPGNRYICEFAQDGWGSQDYAIIVTQPLDCAEQATDVLLSKQAVVNKSSKTAVLYGYIKNTSCQAITDYGFYYCRVLDGEKCKPTAESTKLAVDPASQLVRGQQFSAELTLEDGYTYFYRAYAVINGTAVLSQEIRSISTDPCVQQACCGAPIIYTINAAFEQENQCKLQFLTLQDAINHLKGTSSRNDAYQYVKYTSGSYNLKQPVVMNVVYYDDTPEDPSSVYVYRGTTEVGKHAGKVTPSNSNLIEDINKTSAEPTNTLTIKGIGDAKPSLHHIVLRNSKNIVLDGLYISSDPTGKSDCSIEMDVNYASGSDNWYQLNTVGYLTDANILVQNCVIYSSGFAGAHISSMDGLTFINNDFEIELGKEIDKNYGASFKLMYCKNVKFIENNFRGDHATMMWIQEVENMLVMNNVFWNTNKLTVAAGEQFPAAMRLVTQFSNPIKNVGFFYNTYYFDENDVTASASGYDFLQMTHTVSGGNGNIDLTSIKFQYNNCYSYDADAPGRSSDPFLGSNLSSNENFCPNNFWSEYDQAIYDKLSDEEKAKYTSKFAFGCSNNDFINVKGQVCETSASGPASLMIKGDDLNNGVKPNIAFTGITLTDEEWYSDRYLSAVRPKADEDWTFGAYQSKTSIPTTTIYWVGESDKWDDRNNWEYEITDASGEKVRQRVSCINDLSENLNVVIEEVSKVAITGGRKWPKVPASFDADDRKKDSGIPTAEHVSAGIGKEGFTPIKFASTIELGYGAGLRGVENLNDNGTLRYDQAIVHFDADRDKWLLVGSIVRPFDKEKNDGSTRNVNSGDYFRNYEPQIYMRGTTVENDVISWGKTFGDLNVDVTADTVFAINASVWYGKYYDSAEDYLKYEGIKVDDKAAIPYVFTGRFAVEEHKTEDAYKYTLKNGANKKHLINNVYPCNIDAKKIEEDGLGTINLYDYVKGSFVSTSARDSANNNNGNAFIKAQSGFVFIPNDGKELKLTDDVLAEGSTRTRAANMSLPTFSLDIDNANTTKPGASNIVVRYDEFLGESEESLLNTPKVFTKNADTPEAYIIHKGGQYTRYDAGKEKVTIPLGVRLLKPMNLTFEKVYNNGYDEVVLVDTKTQKFYNLLKRTYTTDVLEIGDTEGRFYLNLTVSGDEDLEEEGDNPGGDEVEDGDETTEVDETVEDFDINIYAVNGNTIHVVTIGTSLQTIYVSDMAGRTDRYVVDGNFAELRLPVSQGVYNVNVIADKATKIVKVILK